MNKYRLKIEDVGEAGSFHQNGRSNLIRVTSAYRPDLSAIIFQCILNEDNDGAPDCYAPTHPPALDPLANGTNDENAIFDPTPGNNKWLWAGLVSMTHKDADDAGMLDRLDETPKFKDAAGRFPLFQPGKKFFVSSTASPADTSKLRTDQARYWNAREVSYGALTPPLSKLGVELGDFGLAIRIDTGIDLGFVYADAGNQNKVGESSRKLFRTLFPAVDQENHPVAFIVFPRSAHRREGGGFRSNPILAIRTRMQDLAFADNIDEVIGLMASGRKYLDYRLGTDPRNVGPSSLSTPQAQSIIRALQRGWGFDPDAARKRQMNDLMSDQRSQMSKDTAAIMRLNIPSPSVGKPR